MVVRAPVMGVTLLIALAILAMRAFSATAESLEASETELGAP
jgi:hypothetical protein